MGDVYKSLSVSGINSSQLDQLDAAIRSIKPNPCDIWGTMFFKDTGVFEMSFGISSDVSSTDMSKFFGSVELAIKGVVGKSPTSAIDIQKGDKCTTARDRREELSSGTAKTP